jgi:hypothetical protein
MPVEQADIQRHLEDYERVTGVTPEGFVCPITLRECARSELIWGHILCEKFKEASRRSIVQYGALDHFYGSRVEDSTIRYVNLIGLSAKDMIAAGGSLTITVEDGTELTAFRGGRGADVKFPSVDLCFEGENVGKVHVKTSKDDARLSGRLAVSREQRFMPSHWVGAMLKAGYLALFEIMGYSIVFDAFGDTLRRTLHAYFFDQAKASEAPRYFGSYPEAVKVLLDANRKPYSREDLDTIEKRNVMFHMTPRERLFAVTCLFRVNGATLAVTLPQSFRRKNCESAEECATAIQFYDRLMRRDPSLAQTVSKATLVNGRWSLEGKDTVSYVDEIAAGGGTGAARLTLRRE